MFAVMIGERMVRVVEKEDAQVLVNVLFELDCTERISSKLIPVLDSSEKCNEKEGEK